MSSYDEVEEADLVAFRLKHELMFSMVLEQEEIQEFSLFPAVLWSHKAP